MAGFRYDVVLDYGEREPDEVQVPRGDDLATIINKGMEALGWQSADVHVGTIDKEK